MRVTQRAFIGMHQSESAATAGHAQITRSRAAWMADEGIRAAAQIGGYLIANAQRAAPNRHDDANDPTYFVVMHDPEGNEFCVG